VRFLSPLLVVLVLIVGLPPAFAQDDDIDLDALDQNLEEAARLQAVAVRALMNEDWEIAQAKAEEALSLEGGIVTAEARLVLARALEMQGRLDDARAAVETFLTLPLLDSHRSRGHDALLRIDNKIDERRARREEERQRRRLRAQRSAEWTSEGPLRVRRGAGLAMVAGGATPAILGAVFVGTDAEYAKSGVRSGTWAAIGAPLLITGLTLEIAGAILALGPSRPVPVAAAVSFDPRSGASFGVVAKW